MAQDFVQTVALAEAEVAEAIREAPPTMEERLIKQHIDMLRRIGRLEVGRMELKEQLDRLLRRATLQAGLLLTMTLVFLWQLFH